MESAHFSSTESSKSESDNKKDGKRTHVVARGDVPSRFSFEQRARPHEQREAMGRALLEGVMFERPRMEAIEAAEARNAKSEKKKTAERVAPQTEGRQPEAEAPALPRPDLYVPPAVFREPGEQSTEATADKGDDSDKKTPTPLAVPRKSFNEVVPRPAAPKEEAPAAEATDFDKLIEAQTFDERLTTAHNEFATHATQQERPLEASAAAEPQPVLGRPAWGHTPMVPPLERQTETAAPAAATLVAERPNFEELLHNMPAKGVSEQVIAEAPAVTPVAVYEDLPQTTNEILGEPAPQTTYANAAPTAQYHEYSAAQPAAGSGEAPPMPPMPPTMEGGPFGSPEWPGEPEPFDETTANALAPAGNILHRGPLRGLRTTETERRLNNLSATESTLVAGVTFLGVLLALEHGARKRHDRKLQKQINAQQKQLKHMGQRLQQEQTAHQETVQTVNRLTTAEQLRQASSPNLAPSAPPSGQHQEHFAAAPVGAGIAPRPAAEHAPRPQQPGRVEQAPQSGQSPEQLAEEQQFASPELRQGERLVRSEWHNIVVDSQGRTVEGAISYGQGFRQEQQQEQIRDRMADSGISGGKAGGGTHAAMQGGGFYQGMSTLPQYSTSPLQQSLQSGMTSPTLPPGASTREDPQHLLAPPKQQAVLKNPWVWLLFVLLILAFFGASLAG